MAENMVQVVLLVGSVLVAGIVGYFIGWYRAHQYKKMVQEVADKLATEMVPLTRVNELIEHDRQRISSDLHDELGTVLSLIHLDLEIILREVDSFPPHIEAKLLTIKKNLNNTIESIRSIIWNLSPDFIEGMSLSFALRELCHKLDALKGTHVHFVQSGNPVPITQRQKLNLFRMVQELFTNSIKHSMAWNISVHLHWEDQLLSITVEDDGSGFRRKEHEQKSEGMGSMNLLRRANSIGATLRHEELNRGLRSIIEIDLSKRDIQPDELSMLMKPSS